MESKFIFHEGRRLARLLADKELSFYRFFTDADIAPENMHRYLDRFTFGELTRQKFLHGLQMTPAEFYGRPCQPPPPFCPWSGCR
ncbi:hypothetical protein MKQ68_20105 [Chitinophaga horti]|uniref:Uncharacterized protein n=1 Tax=Chitinophaga horti TaxID=2920382 RepID=A0ABY6IYD0_9BACT|nr:hypothetical protein [Chitinophaga horti]UYQ92391.1 hypothetical protein MKQ68_20105 [Chitinophaga horti]